MIALVDMADPPGLALLGEVIGDARVLHIGDRLVISTHQGQDGVLRPVLVTSKAPS
jgi:hypothetical protein